MIGNISHSAAPASPGGIKNTTQYSRLRASADRASFSRLLEHYQAQGAEDKKARGAAPHGVSPNQPEIIKALDDFVGDWRHANLELEKLSDRLPKEIKPLLDTQRLMYRLSLQSQLISRFGETLTSTVRRLQQFGGG